MLNSKFSKSWEILLESGRSVTNDEIDQAINRFQQSIGLESVIADYLLHMYKSAGQP
jgi:hypothetical protein